MTSKIIDTSMFKDIGVLAYSGIAMIFSMIPVGLNEWLLAGSLVSAIVLAISRTYLIWKKDSREKKHGKR